MKKNTAKGYTNASLIKLAHLFTTYIRKFETTDPEKIKMCISKGNRKIGRVLNVSLPPMLTCANCKECRHYCYDIKACLQYPNTVIDARIRNYTILQKNRALYFDTIRETLKRRRKNKFFRWHVSGDIIDADYLENMIAIAKDFPNFKFWTYTKNYTLINDYIGSHGKNRKKAIPANLSIMFSEWKGLDIPNPYKMPVFACKFPNETQEKYKNMFKCAGNCEFCTAHNKGCVKGENTYNDLH